MKKCEVVRYAENGERLNPCDNLQEIIDTNTIKLFEIHELKPNNITCWAFFTHKGD